MTQEEKDLMLRDLCARLPYHPKVRVKVEDVEYDEWWTLATIQDLGKIQYTCIPYLRPMSSMTDEEQLVFSSKCELTTDVNGEKVWSVKVVGYDWLNSHHFDFRNLIDKGLAIDCTNLNIY